MCERKKKNNPRAGDAPPRFQLWRPREILISMLVSCADGSTKGQNSQIYEDHVRRKFSASSGDLSRYVLCSSEMLNMAGL